MDGVPRGPLSKDRSAAGRSRGQRPTAAVCLRAPRWTASLLERTGGHADAQGVQRLATVHPLVAFLTGGLLVWVALTFVGSRPPGRTPPRGSQLELAAGPLDGSVVPAPDAPAPPDGGPNAAALWVHDTAFLPAAPVELLAAAGIPVEIVHGSRAAFRHPLVLSWPSTRLNRRQRVAFAAYSRRGGTLLAIAPDAVTSRALTGRRGAVIARLASVPETGLQNGGLRDRQIAALRRWWSATPGGFHLGDAPAGRRPGHRVRARRAQRVGGLRRSRARS